MDWEKLNRERDALVSYIGPILAESLGVERADALAWIIATGLLGNEIVACAPNVAEVIAEAGLRAESMGC